MILQIRIEPCNFQNVNVRNFENGQKLHRELSLFQW
jgi:hypothetical protein